MKKSSNEEKRGERVRRFNAAYESAIDVEVIPSKKDLGIDSDNKIEMVGPYCRVSTLQETQAESFELQKKYYEEYVSRWPNWELADIYADEGISATSMKRRKDFLRLMEDCKAGKITKIITKSVSRFARNVVDCVSLVRMLRALPHPVGVYFETEHIDTLTPESDAQLSLLASFAESESLNKSTSMKWAIRGRFERGIPRLADLYGFTRNGKELSINEHEAQVVRSFYYQLLEGWSIGEIKANIEKIGVPSPSGMNTWNYATIKYIIANEKNCGDVFCQKTVTVDVFSHKSVPNKGQERQYRLYDHHEPIVSRDTWLQAQQILGLLTLREMIDQEKEYTIPQCPDVSFHPVYSYHKEVKRDE